MSLIEHLQQIRDFRTQPRYPLWVVLLLVIMGTMSDCLGYRALEEFVERHQKVLLELMELPHQRLPSYSTMRRVMVRIDFQALTQAFNAWAAEAFAVASAEQVALDGKSIKASVKDYDNSYQDFVSVVSAFSVQQGVVVGLQAMHNHKESEIVTVQSLLDVLQLKGVCFSMDALHTQKKRSSKLLTVAMTT
jgi:hypothetical protein